MEISKGFQWVLQLSGGKKAIVALCGGKDDWEYKKWLVCDKKYIWEISILERSENQQISSWKRPC